jgi:hypothetical protein
VLSDPTDTSSTGGQPWRAVDLAPSTGSIVRGEAMPLGWIPPVSFAGRVPVVQYPRLYSIQTDGAYHAKGWSFDKGDYSTGGRWRDDGAGLLKCPPTHKRLQRPDVRMRQRLWAAWKEETVTSADHGAAALLPPPKGGVEAKARKLGGYGGTLGTSERLVFMRQQIPNRYPLDAPSRRSPSIEHGVPSTELASVARRHRVEVQIVRVRGGGGGRRQAEVWRTGGAHG